MSSRAQRAMDRIKAFIDKRFSGRNEHVIPPVDARLTSFRTLPVENLSVRNADEQSSTNAQNVANWIGGRSVTDRVEPSVQEALETIQRPRALAVQMRSSNDLLIGERRARIITTLNDILMEHSEGEPESDREEDKVDRIFENCTATTPTAIQKSIDDCTICLNGADHPIGCTSCKNLIGCLSCCKKWAESSMKISGMPSCPLCRNEWKTSDNVEELSVADN